MDFIQFIGRFHVLLLHLPIGILVMAACLEIHTIWKKRERSQAMQAVWLWGAISAIGTCILGYMLSLSGGYNAEAVQIHMTFGISVAVFSTFCWAYFAKASAHKNIIVVGLSVIQLLLLTFTGHYGANMTHGSTFLVEKAPQFVRSMMGLPPAATKRPKPESMDVAMIFPDIIQPIFEARCVGCHNDEKTKGELKLNSYASILKGGKTGPAVIAGSIADSELYQRITLFDSDEKFMPAEGKTPLSENQVNMLKWWIENGAVENVPLKDVDVSVEINAMIAADLGFTATKQIVLANEIDENIVSQLESAGFKFRRILQNEPYVSVIYSTPLVPLTDEVLDKLLSLKEQITELKLSRSSLNDAQMAKIGQLTELYSLNISGTKVTNDGVSQLKNLIKIRSLNLFDTKVTNDIAEKLKNLPELNKIYQSE